MLVGGGTGGHVTPLLAVAEELLDRGAEAENIYLITDKDSAKKDYIQGHRINLLTIVSGKFSRFLTIYNLFAPFLVFWGFLESLYLLLRIRPQVIFAKGAYLSAPMIIAAWILRVPIYLHESDSVMGASNKRMLSFAEAVFVSFPIDIYQGALQNKLKFSGLPIRKRFFEIETGELSDKKIMIMGGSQGSEKINFLMGERIEKYLGKFEIYHICGEKHFEKFHLIRSKLTSELQKRYHLYGFLGTEIERKVSSADLIISRAGATSLFELAALGKPSLLIPLPSAAANHQLRNAEIFEMEKAAKVIHESKINEEILYDEVNKLMKDREKREKLARNIKKFSRENAAKIIADYLLKS